MITNSNSGTNVHEVADRIYRINTPVGAGADAFNFNQYLVAADAPLLFHTGPRKMFPWVAEAVAKVLPLASLRYVGLSHFEGDECGSMDEFLASAPHAVPVCSAVAKMIAVDDVYARPALALADGEALDLGSHDMRWFDTPHVPHGWECGLMMEERTATLLCGDLFTQWDRGEVALTESDILGKAEAARRRMDYFAHAPATSATLERLAAEAPRVLACMHGSAFRGDGAAALRALAQCLAANAPATASTMPTACTPEIASPKMTSARIAATGGAR